MNTNRRAMLALLATSALTALAPQTALADARQEFEPMITLQQPMAAMTRQQIGVVTPPAPQD